MTNWSRQCLRLKEKQIALRHAMLWRVFGLPFMVKLCQFRERKSPPISGESSPVFVVGCGHSGTSLMTAILDTHSRLEAIPGETQIFSRWHFREKVEYRYRRAVSQIVHDERRPLEKTPRHVLVLDRIFRFFPRSQVVLMVRDGRDVACSIQRRTGSLKQGIDRWIHDNSRALPFINDERLFLVHYEQLVKAPETTLRRVCEFLNVTYEEELLSFHTKERPWYGNQTRGGAHSRRRAAQIHTPIHDASGKWQSELSSREKAIIEQKAADLLKRFGYA